MKPVRILIVSDIHGNLEALDAVLAHSQATGGFEQMWCLGDVVGYGPDPVACIARLRRHQPICVVGNHDAAAVGRIGLEEFNYHAAEACRWTAKELTKEHQDYLRDLPLTAQQGDFTLVHGSLRDPVWEYLLSYEAAIATFARCSTIHCLVGHSHIPFVCEEGKGFTQLKAEESQWKLERTRLIINPGSVGQPRDGDPRASYMLYDTDAEAIGHHRLSYAIPITQAKMGRARLPQPLIDRLAHGW